MMASKTRVCGPIEPRRLVCSRQARKTRVAATSTELAHLRTPVTVDWEHYKGKDVPLNLYGGKKAPFIGKVRNMSSGASTLKPPVAR